MASSRSGWCLVRFVAQCFVEAVCFYPPKNVYDTGSEFMDLVLPSRMSAGSPPYSTTLELSRISGGIPIGFPTDSNGYQRHPDGFCPTAPKSGSPPDLRRTFSRPPSDLSLTSGPQPATRKRGSKSVQNQVPFRSSAILCSPFRSRHEARQ